MKLFLYSHTHWDREWYLSRNQFQYRLVRTVDEIIEALEANNAFGTFVLDGQTSIVEDYLELRPERRDALRELIESGKLVIGPWYTMPDVFLPDGESLIRNLAFGFRDCRAYGAEFPNVGYIPDSFGHIEQLPQLLRGVGIDNFLFSRGLPCALREADDYTREFVWRAPNGDDILAVHLPDGYFNAMFLPSPADGVGLRRRITKIAEQFQHHSACPELVLGAHGIDHCWLQRDMPEILETLPKLMPEVEFHHGSVQEYLDALKQELDQTQLQTWQGQLRGRLNIDELHGTLSSRMDNKINNERARMHLQNLAEPLDAAAGRAGKPAATPFLVRAWEKLLQNHAHDSICGCSQDRVHDDVNTRFREVIETGIDIADGALDYLNNNALRDGIPTVVVYAGLNGGNPVVDFVIRLAEKPGPKACLRDSDGRDHPVQFDDVLRMKTYTTDAEPVICWECRGCVFIADLQPCEVRRLRYCPEGTPELPPNPVTADQRSLNNGHVGLSVNTNGTITLKRTSDEQEIPGLHFFAHDTDVGGGYHYEPLPRSKRRTTLNGTAEVAQISSGPLRAVLQVTCALRVPAEYDREKAQLRGRRTLRLVSQFTLETGSNLIKVKTSLNNNASNQRVRLVLPGNSRTARVRADAAFAVHENHIDKWTADTAQNFHPMRGFADLADTDGGFAVITKGLHEYEIMADEGGQPGLEVTLLRSVDSTLQCSTWMTPGAQLHGEHHFEYALAPHAGDWRAAALPRLSASFRAPAIANVHGDVPVRKNPYEPFATLGYAELKDGREILRDTNRSSWKTIHSQRDGWKRIESDRFLDGDLPHRILPFSLHGANICISAYKRAADGNGEIIRLWSWHDQPQTVKISTASPGAEFTACNLLEQPLDDAPPSRGSAEFHLRPFQILTLRLYTM